MVTLRTNVLPNLRGHRIHRQATLAASAVKIPHSFSGPPFSLESLQSVWDVAARVGGLGSSAERGGGGRVGQETRPEDLWSFSRERPHQQPPNYMSAEHSTTPGAAPRESRSLSSSSSGALFSQNGSTTQPTSLQSGNVPASNAPPVAGTAQYDPRTFFRPRTPPEPSAQSASRSLGLQNMLNPTGSDLSHGTGPSDQASVKSLRTGDSTALPAPSGSSPRSRKRSQRSVADEPYMGVQSLAPRRTLTPVSAARRVEGLGGRRATIGPTVAGQQAALLSAGSRVYTVEPGLHHESEIPPLPVSSLVRSTLSDPNSVEGAINSLRPPGNIYALGMEASLNRRQSESPGTSQSSYSHISQPSPIFSHHSVGTPQQSYLPLQPAPPGPFSQSLTVTGIAESHRHQVPGQAPLQMTLNTDQGTMVVPVDVQQASRTANEKRKRNASASARFRARRKEKEKEASHTIVSLERQLRDMTEERDHYRTERDYFRELVTRQVDLQQLPPRPASPLSRRAAPLLPPITAESASSAYQEHFRDSSEPLGRAPLRRRTEEHGRLSSGPVSASPMLPPQIPFSSQPPGLPHSLPPVAIPPALPSPFSDPRIGRQGGPPAQHQPPPPGTRSHSYDPFRPERLERNWEPSRQP